MESKFLTQICISNHSREERVKRFVRKKVSEMFISLEDERKLRQAWKSIASKLCEIYFSSYVCMYRYQLGISCLSLRHSVRIIEIYGVNTEHRNHTPKRRIVLFFGQKNNSCPPGVKTRCSPLHSSIH
jgi:hypothetical protein